jgi:hypothetical protein
MKNVMLAIALAGLLSVMVGCAYPVGYGGSFIVDAKHAVAVGDPSAAMTKEGKAEVVGIIIITLGDGSISAACKDGGITKIHHVDVEQLGVLGIYSRTITRVYGQ